MEIESLVLLLVLVLVEVVEEVLGLRLLPPPMLEEEDVFFFFNDTRWFFNWRTSFRRAKICASRSRRMHLLSGSVRPILLAEVDVDLRL